MPAKTFTPDEILTAEDVNAYLANKSISNAIINGAFDIWQRGTSFNVPSSGLTYSADRFYAFNNGNGTITHSRQTFTPGIAPVAGYEGQFFHRNSIASVGTTTGWIFQQRIEDVRTFAGQAATFSFWARSSNTQTLSVSWEQNFGSGGSTTVTGTLAASINLTSSWTRYSYTVTLPSISGKTIGTNPYLIYGFGQGSAVKTGDLDIWGVQLESGTVANDFRRNANNLQGELAACQRYYCKTFPLTVAPASNAGQAGSILCPRSSTTAATAYVAWWQFPVSMRATPNTITTFNPSAAGSGFFDESGSSVAATAGNQSNNAVSIYNTGAAVVGRNAVIHAVADAEV
jgi:hypothetical protein